MAAKASLEVYYSHFDEATGRVFFKSKTEPPIELSLDGNEWKSIGEKKTLFITIKAIG